jgi:S1-C subfamily serine protease
VSSSPGAGSGTRLLAAVVLSACVGLVGGGLAAWGVYTHFGPAQRVVTQTKTGGGSISVGDIAASVQPSLVIISTQPTTASGLAGGGSTGLAQGFAVSTDGLVVTSTAAVRGATRLRVATADGHAYDATIAATDLPDGLVVLRASGATGLQPLRFAAQSPRIGDIAVVVSDAALAPLSARSGVVASVGITASDGTAAVSDMFSVDATPALDAGGAPVVESGGTVTGVVTEVASASGVMAASGRDAAALVAGIPAGSASPRPSFGVTAAPIDAATSAATGLPVGVLVTTVDPGGPAAGLLAAGDVVTAVNGSSVETGSAFLPSTFDLQAGQQTTLTVVGSSGASRSVTITVGTG